MATKKKTVKKRTKQNSSTILPQPKLYPLSSKKPETKKPRPFHAVGVLKTENEMTTYHEGIYSQFTDEQIKTHIPQYHVVPYSHGDNPRPLSAAQIRQRRKKKQYIFP